MKKTGLIIFVSAFTFFISLLFIGEFKVNDKALISVLGKENKEKVGFIKSTKIYSEISGVELNNQFALVEKIKQMFYDANKLVIDRYGITKEDISNLIYNSTVDEKVSYSQESIDKTFDKNDNISGAKNKQISDNTGWMFSDQREYSSISAFQQDLENKANEITASVKRDKGFDENRVASYAYSVIKVSSSGFIANNKWLIFFLTYIMICLGGLLYILPGLSKKPGIKNDGIFHHPGTNIGWIGILVGTFLITFYVFLYFYPEYITNWILPVDPISESLSGNPASQWFMYGFMYCLAMMVMGTRMIIKYRHNKYQIIRTCSVIFFQLAFAFLIPEILVRLNEPWYDFKNMWPLDYDFFFEWNIDNHINAGSLGTFMLVWGIILFVIGVPFFTYFFGKRWYCSWVCGCGGLAETLGDPYRQLSDKSLKAWKIERYLIHGVLVFAILMTGLTLYTYFSGAGSVLGVSTGTVQKTYGFLIGSVFSGVVGTGFYPLMGNRVWCRFGCPLAAYLGIVQKFKSRFRITTNGGQCISCGNCSTYCEMGIDVRAYAQKGQNIVRSSCVGCGVCSAVCPRGVLKLENGPVKNRVEDNPIILGNDGVLKLNEELS